MSKYTNALINETSPYLLQHAHNPVNWLPWSEVAFEKAKKENKLVLVSIGYATCHWCHVMEKEAFENEEVAFLMNQHFICIKVDREERPDIDNFYMLAVQLMTRSGGWPLNCFTLPNKQPIFGGTYFPKNQWINALNSLNEGWNTAPETFFDYANKLSDAMKFGKSFNANKSNKTEHINIDEKVEHWRKYLDFELGGADKAPKFPMPNNLSFLLDYSLLKKDSKIENHVFNSLNKMALGGIYDQVGGGFSRYSVDKEWKVPHFEKMLYDNAQLISLYAKAYAATKNNFQKEFYKKTIEQTVLFLEREMKNDLGGYYSGIDADSEGVEGKFYCWTKQEIKSLPEDFQSELNYFYEINSRGFWEENYILLLEDSLEEKAKSKNITTEEFFNKWNNLNNFLLSIRENRIRPITDTKVLLSWNALLITTFVNCAKYLDDSNYLKKAEALYQFIESNLVKNELLYRTWHKNESKTAAFIEDYACYTEALLSIFEITGNESYLQKAKTLADKSLDLFYQKEEGLFAFSQAQFNEFPIPDFVIDDNVIPSPNSIMAINFAKLTSYFGEPKYQEIANNMFKKISADINFAAGFSNWLIFALNEQKGWPTLVVSGVDTEKQLKKLYSIYLPTVNILENKTNSKAPIFENRFNPKKTQFYFCVNHACLKPQEEINEALSSIKETLYNA